MAQMSNGTACEVIGDKDNPVVVLIHGLGMTRGMWDAFVPPLTKNHRVLRYDLYGHGQSSMPPGTPDLRVYARQLCGVLDELGMDRVAIIGFSLGGMINRQFCMDYPDRVAALAMINTPHKRSAAEQSRVEARAGASMADGPASGLDATMARWFTPEFIRTRPDYILHMHKVILANDPVSYGQCRMVLAKGVVELIEPRPPLDCPALIMTCENDSGSTPAMSYGMATEIAGAEVLVVPHLQHCGLLEQPDLFTRPLLMFLDKNLSCRVET